MSTTMIPDRWRPRPDTVRRALAALLAVGAAAVTVLILAGVLPGEAFFVAAAALLALPGARYGWGLLETVAPKPDVRGPRHALVEVVPHVPPGDDTLTALADSVLTRRVRVDGDETATTAIPQVQA